MDCKTIFIVLIALINNKIITSYGAVCEDKSYCLCHEETSGKYIIRCKAAKENKNNSSLTGFFEINIYMHQYTEIHCIDALDWSEFTLGNSSSLNLSYMETLSFFNCSPPGPKHSQRVAKMLGLHQVSYLNFENATSLPTREDIVVYSNLVAFKLNKTNGSSNNVSSDIFNSEINSLKRFDWVNSNLEQLPPGFFNNAKRFESVFLNNNRLNKIETGTFDGLSNVTQFYLSNNRIEDLQPDVFRNMTNLLFLNLESNNIRILHHDVFQDLLKLNTIDLCFNNIVSIPRGLFSSNKGLIIFKFCSNKQNLTELPDDLFNNLILLDKVNLSNIGLTKLHNNTFNDSIHLTTLDINDNYLRKLPDGIFYNLIDLLYLNLSSNLLDDLSDKVFEHTYKLLNLDLSNNRLTVINEFIFKNLNQLEKLNLSRNNLSRIHIDAFKFLARLKVARLNNIQLKLSNPSSFYEQNDFQTDLLQIESFFNGCVLLEELYLADNILTEFKGNWFENNPKLKILDLSKNAINDLLVNELNFKTNYLQIDLSYNNITYILLLDAYMYEFDLKYSELNERNVQVNLTGNPLKCDCEVYNFLRFINGHLYPNVYNYVTFLLDNLVCHTPKNLYGKPIKTIMENTFTCLMKNSTEYYFDPCSASESVCECMWHPYNQIIDIDCSNRNLTRVPEKLYQKSMLEINLDLSRNKLKEPPTIDNIDYFKVTNLNLANNKITSIDEKLMLLPNLRTLNLDGNNLTTIDHRILDRIFSSKNQTTLTKITSLYLANNPWPCDCKTNDLLNFIRINMNKVKDALQVNCIDHLRNQHSLITLSQNELCPPSNIYVILVLVFLSILVLIITYFFIFYQKQIKIWLYSKNYCLCLITEEDLDKDKTFDAFISYSHKDEEFVFSELIKHLEEEGSRPYKLCIHVRDWVAGEWIPTQIERSVAESRRTIIVLSRDFIESDWSIFEFQAAHKLALKEKRIRVIVILLGDIGPFENLDKDLRAYLHTNTYIKWGDPWFWRKLRFAMPRYRQFDTTEQNIN